MAFAVFTPNPAGALEIPFFASFRPFPLLMQTLLRDPDKLRVLLATNPALAAIIAQSASSMGLNLPSLHR